MILVLSVCIIACSSDSLPAITTLETRTDAQIEELLLDRSRQELINEWGEPHYFNEAKNLDIFHLNPDHLPDKTHKIILVYYDDNFRVKSVSTDACN